MEEIEKVPLKELLEVIQHNLAFSIDSIYNQTKQLIGKEKEHNLGFLKEQLKGQIENYLKIVVKNIDYQIFKIVEARDFPPLYEQIKNQISKHLNEAIKNE